MLKGKTILLGVTEELQHIKAPAWPACWSNPKAEVHVLMTEHATNFITPITFETLTGNRCVIDTFDGNFEFQVEHVALAQKADAFVIAPATANVIAKIAHGMAEDMLTTTFLACKCPKIIVPAMNTAMYENAVTQNNLEALRKYGMEIIDPASGRLACGDTGAGKMPEPETILQHIYRCCACPKDMLGLKVLVTAGPTQGSHRSCQVHYQPLFGKDGIQYCEGLYAKGARLRW